MQTQTYQLNTDEYREFQTITGLLQKDAPISDFLFFDIETTGLDTKCCYIYLIGYICMEDNIPTMTQLFSEDIEEEKLILEEFRNKVNNYKYLINYNGRRFDMGFIKSRYAIYSHNAFFKANECRDIYEYLTPYRAILKLNSMKQINLEQFCGYARNDAFTGQELINLYLTYLAGMKTAKNRLKSTIISSQKHFLENDFSTCPDSGLAMLGNIDLEYTCNAILNHNHEDLIGMLKLDSVLQFCSALKDNENYSYEVNIREKEQPAPSEYSTETDTVDESVSYADICIEMNKELMDFILLHRLADNMPSDYFTDNTLHFTLAAINANLKRFYPDYKDYNYLPGEDTAIHKNASWFLDSGLRVKATPETCYTRHNGLFLLYPPVEKEDTKHFSIFRKEYHSKYCYISLSELSRADSAKRADMLHEYFIYLLKDPQKFLQIFAPPQPELL